MGWKERLYERPLRRPLDDPTRRALEADFARRRDEIPVPLEFSWCQGGSSFRISSRWASFLVQFTGDRMLVDANLSLAAKMMATDENRRQVVRFISMMADDLNL